MLLTKLPDAAQRRSLRAGSARLLLLSALAIALLTLLGAAGESVGLDRLLKVNTVKRRTHSLFRQVCDYYYLLPTMRPASAVPLMKRFGELILQQRICTEIFGIIYEGMLRG